MNLGNFILKGTGNKGQDFHLRRVFNIKGALEMNCEEPGVIKKQDVMKSPNWRRR